VHRTTWTGIATTPCFAITEFNSDGNGNGRSTLMFPQEGDFAGDFYVTAKGASTFSYQTRLVPNNNNETYMATLLPETQTNFGADTTASPQDPLTSGSVTSSNGSLKFTVQGAAPNTTYTTDVSETPVIDSSGTYQLSSFATDGMGNGASTASLQGTPGDIFQVRPAKNAGFIGGFSIPHP